MSVTITEEIFVNNNVSHIAVALWMMLNLKPIHNSVQQSSGRIILVLMKICMFQLSKLIYEETKRLSFQDTSINYNHFIMTLPCVSCVSYRSNNNSIISIFNFIDINRHAIRNLRHRNAHSSIFIVSVSVPYVLPIFIEHFQIWYSAVSAHTT